MLETADAAAHLGICYRDVVRAHASKIEEDACAGHLRILDKGKLVHRVEQNSAEAGFRRRDPQRQDSATAIIKPQRLIKRPLLDSFSNGYLVAMYKPALGARVSPPAGSCDERKQPLRVTPPRDVQCHEEEPA